MYWSILLEHILLLDFIGEIVLLNFPRLFNRYSQHIHNIFFLVSQYEKVYFIRRSFVKVMNLFNLVSHAFANDINVFHSCKTVSSNEIKERLLRLESVTFFRNLFLRECSFLPNPAFLCARAKFFFLSKFRTIKYFWGNA